MDLQLVKPDFFDEIFVWRKAPFIKFRNRILANAMAPGRLLRQVLAVIIDPGSLGIGVWINVLLTLACVHSLIFNDFHMSYFLRFRGLTAEAVAAAHSVFIFWNPLNDIAAGWLSDAWTARRGPGSRLELLQILYCGWAFTSVLAFSPQLASSLPAGLAYGLAIFLADGFASVAIVVRASCVIELTTGEKERIQVQRLNSVFGCAEWVVTFGALCLWPATRQQQQQQQQQEQGERDESSLTFFRAYLLIVCASSAATTVLAVRVLRHWPSKQRRRHCDERIKASDECGGEQEQEEEEEEEEEGLPGRRRPPQSQQPRQQQQQTLHGGQLQPPSSSVCSFARSIARDWNLHRFLACNSLLEAEAVFHDQFDVLIVGILLVGSDISSGGSSRGHVALVGAIKPLSGLASFVLTWVAEDPRVGVYGVCLGCFAARLVGLGLVLGFVMTSAVGDGRGGPGGAASWAIALSLVLSNATTRAPLAFSGISLGNIVDEHTRQLKQQEEDDSSGGEGVLEMQPENKAHPAAGSGSPHVSKFLSLNALIAKPLSSLGPIIGSAALAQSSSSSRSSNHDETERRYSACLWLVVVLPMATAAFQLLVWRGFSLRGKRPRQDAEQA